MTPDYPSDSILNHCRFCSYVAFYSGLRGEGNSKMFCPPNLLRNAFTLMLALLLPMLAPVRALIAADVTIRNSPAQTRVAQIQPEETLSTLVIGANDQNELALLTEMSILLLEDAGFEVIHLQAPIGSSTEALGDEVGAPSARQSIEQQIVDLQWQYPRESLVAELNVRIELVPNDPDLAWELAAAVDNKYTNFQWLPPVDFYNANTMIIRPDAADEIKTIEDLAIYLEDGESELFFCVDEVFYEDADGLTALLEHYGIELSNDHIAIAEADQIYEAIAYGLCDLIVGRNIDGRVNHFNLRSLSDSRNFFPMSGPALMTRDDVLEQHPEVGDLLGQLGAYIDDATMAQLNARIQIGEDGVPNNGDEESIRTVAQNFLQELGVLGAGSIVIGTTDDAEQRTMGQLLSHLLEEAGYNAVERRGFASTADVRAALEAKEIDLYVDRVGIALGAHYGLDATTWPLALDRIYKLVQTLNDPSDILWLDDITLVTENMLLVNPQRFEAGIASVDNLADELANVVPGVDGTPWRVCVAPQILETPYSVLNAIQESYDFHFDGARVEAVAVSDLALTINGDGCDLAVGFPQGRQFGTDTFVPLEDGRNIVSLFAVTPVTRLSVFDNFPELSNILKQLAEPLAPATIQSLISLNQVGSDGIAATGDEVSMDLLIRRFVAQPSVAPERITADVLRETIAATTRETTAPDNSTIRLGLETEPTRHLAMQLLGLLLEEQGHKVDVALTTGNPVELRTALENGEIDLYIESTETALMTYYELSAETFPTDPERTFALIRSLDKPAGIIWLAPLPLSTDLLPELSATRMILVDEQLADNGIATLADLAQLVGDGQPTLQLCIQSELIQTEPGRLGSLEDLYGFPINLKDLFMIQASDVPELLSSEKCDIIDAFMAADAFEASPFTAIDVDPNDSVVGDALLDDTVLDDAASYLIAPLAREEILMANSDLRAQIEEAFLMLDARLLDTIKRSYDVESTEIANAEQQSQLAEAARSYLCNRQLLSSCPVESIAREAGFEETADEAAAEATDEATEIVPPAERQEIEVLGRAEATASDDIGAEIALDIEAEPPSDSVSEPATEPITNTPALTDTSSISGSLILSDTLIGRLPISETIDLSDTPAVSNTATLTESAMLTEPITFSEPVVLEATIPITVPTAYRVNVRATSSTDALIVDVLRRGTEWIATGRTGDNSWLQIELNDGRRAWVFASAILFPRDRIETLPIIAPPTGITALN